jgi:tetratricopeptide (TPR) repeat protein
MIDAINALRTEIGAEGVPWTDEEVIAYRRALYRRNDTINHNDTEVVTAFIAELQRCAKWCLDPELKRLCDLIRARYLFAIGKEDDCRVLITIPKKQMRDLTEEHLYWYHRCLGFMAHSAWQYKEALFHYIKAEKYGTLLNLTAGLGFRMLNYNIGCCLSQMDYSYLTVAYLEKAQTKEYGVYSVEIAISIQRRLAVGYGKLKQTEKALELLRNCLNYAMEAVNGRRTTMGGIYLDIGIVYRDAGNFSKALENFNIVAEHCDKDSEAYLACMCYIASLLRMNGKYDEVRQCLGKYLPRAVKGTLWYEWLHGIRHSLTLENPSSRKYIRWTTIPNLLTYGKHALVMESYMWLSDYYKSANSYKPALECNEQATLIYKQLTEGDLSL